MNLVLGGAQIGNKYGLYNNKNFSSKEFNKFEKLILSSKIKYIDTAQSYGKSEKIIGNSKLKNLKIITKINFTFNEQNKIEKNILLQVSKSLKDLNQKRVYAILIHDHKSLINKNGKILIKVLTNLKKRKIVKKIGVSLYSPAELDKIWKFWKPDIIQIPFNILDQRILRNGWINKLKKKKIKLFIRSCFLQGILINNFQNKILMSTKSKSALNKFFKWCEKNKINKVKACLDFVRQFKKIDFFVIGFDDRVQLMQVLKLLKLKKINIPKRFIYNDLNLIDPRRWKKII